MEHIIKECQYMNKDFLFLDEIKNGNGANIYKSLRIPMKYLHNEPKWNILIKGYPNQQRTKFYLVSGKYITKYRNSISTDEYFCALKYAN